MTETIAPPTRSRFAVPSALRSEPVRIGLSAAIGAGVVLAGFDPFNHAADVLGTDTRPWAVVVMPGTLVAVAAALGTLLFPARAGRSPRLLVAGAVLLLLASVASVAGSAGPRGSAVIAVSAVTMPILLALAVSRSRLSLEWTLGAFLAATTVLLLRADLTFLADNGLPTPGVLQAAKFENVPGDLHYLTLGNPDHTAGWLMMPLVLAGFWAVGRRGAARIALFAVAAVAFATTVLCYARFAIATDVLLAVLLVAVVPVTRRVRIALLLAVFAGAAAMAVVGFDYLKLIVSDDSDSTLSERINSLGDGLAVLGDHVFSGVGLGRYATGNGYFPAHSSIVQAGAEMGIAGLLALVTLTLGCVRLAVKRVRASGWFRAESAAALAVAAYAIHAALAAPSSSGLFSGDVAIWAMTGALLIGLAVRRD